MYWVLYLVTCITGLLVGFVHTSNGSAITEKIKTWISVVFYVLLFSLIILALLEKSWTLVFLAAFFFVFSPGVGQVMTLLMMRRKNEIGLFSWIMTFLFAAFVVYALMFGKNTLANSQQWAARKTALIPKTSPERGGGIRRSHTRRMTEKL